MPASHSRAVSSLQWTIAAASTMIDHQQPWDQLCDRLAAPAVLSAEFMSTCLRWFGNGDEILIIARDGAAPILACVVSKGRLSWSTFQPSQAPMGAWLSDPAWDKSRLMREVTAKLGLLLGSATQLDPRFHVREENHADTRVDSYIETARLAVDQPWKDYWESRSKNLRQNHRKAMNRIRKAGLAVEYAVESTPQAMAQAVYRYADLESAGWKSAQGTAVMRNNDQGAFYVDLMTRLATHGQGRVYSMTLGGEPVAVDLAVISRRCLIVLKTTYAEAAAEFSPAALLREHYFKDLFDQAEVDSIEFYGRAMDWHRRWSDDIRELFHMTVFRNRPLRAATELSSGVRKQIQSVRHRVRGNASQSGVQRVE